MAIPAGLEPATLCLEVFVEAHKILTRHTYLFAAAPRRAAYNCEQCWGFAKRRSAGAPQGRWCIASSQERPLLVD